MQCGRLAQVQQITPPYKSPSSNGQAKYWPKLECMAFNSETCSLVHSAHLKNCFSGGLLRKENVNQEFSKRCHCRDIYRLSSPFVSHQLSWYVNNEAPDGTALGFA